MKQFKEFIKESIELTEAKTWPLGLSKKNTHKFVMFKRGAGAEEFEILRKNGYTFLDLNYNKIISYRNIGDVHYIETGKNGIKDIKDDFEDFGVVAGPAGSVK